VTFATKNEPSTTVSILN